MPYRAPSFTETLNRSFPFTRPLTDAYDRATPVQKVAAVGVAVVLAPVLAGTVAAFYLAHEVTRKSYDNNPSCRSPGEDGDER
jgi:hypothetical protein